MITLREAAQQALEALEDLADCGAEAWSEQRPCVQIGREAITDLRAALAEPVQEPTGYFSVNDYGRWEENENEYGTPLYTAPPQRKSLTDEVIAELWYKNGTHHHHFARAIERWLKGEQ